MTYDYVLTDAQGRRMAVKRLAIIKVRAKHMNGNLNKEGKYHVIPCIVSSALVDDIFLSWKDLIKVGSIFKHFPEVWTSEQEHLEKRATMTNKERCRMSSDSHDIHPEINKVFDKYEDVFSENLTFGKSMRVPMEIELDEDIARKYRGHYTTHVRRPPICMENAAAKLVNELVEGGIIKECTESVEFLARAHFVMKSDGERVRLVSDYSPALNKCIRKKHHGFSAAGHIRESLSHTSKCLQILLCVRSPSCLFPDPAHRGGQQAHRLCGRCGQGRPQVRLPESSHGSVLYLRSL